MMKLASSAIFRRSKFGFQKWNLLRYSTTATSTDSLSGQLSPVRILEEGSIIPVLDQWVEERRDVEKHDLRNAITMLREHGIVDRALEVCEWMSDRRCMKVDEHDVAARLYLIFQVYGAGKAESYFNNIAPEFKGMETYNTLLDGYIQKNYSDKKVEATVQKMKELGFKMSKSSYYGRLRIYERTRKEYKVRALLLEMKELGFLSSYDIARLTKSEERLKAEVEKAENDFNSIAPECRDGKAYGMLLGCYAKSNLVEKAEATVQRMKEEGLMKETSFCNAVLNLYSQTEDTVKFNALVSEMEENGVKFDKVALGTMLTAYAKASDKGGVKKTLQLIESNPKDVPDWIFFSTAVHACMDAEDGESPLTILASGQRFYKGY